MDGAVLRMVGRPPAGAVRPPPGPAQLPRLIPSAPPPPAGRECHTPCRRLWTSRPPATAPLLCPAASLLAMLNLRTSPPPTSLLPAAAGHLRVRSACCGGRRAAWTGRPAHSAAVDSGGRQRALIVDAQQSTIAVRRRRHRGGPRSLAGTEPPGCSRAATLARPLGRDLPRRPSTAPRGTRDSIQLKPSSRKPGPGSNTGLVETSAQRQQQGLPVGGSFLERPSYLFAPCCCPRPTAYYHS